jgi:hypothetical protein
LNHQVNSWALCNSIFNGEFHSGYSERWSLLSMSLRDVR